MCPLVYFNSDSPRYKIHSTAHDEGLYDHWLGDMWQQLEPGWRCTLDARGQGTFTIVAAVYHVCRVRSGYAIELPVSDGHH
jgi:hypothetical protein